MVLRLICSCGNEINVEESSSSAEVRCRRCGRLLETAGAAADSFPTPPSGPSLETRIFSGSPDSAGLETPSPKSEDPDSEITRISDPAGTRRDRPNPVADDEYDFEIGSPESDPVVDDDATQIADSIHRPSDASEPRSSSDANRSSASRSSNVDLSERVMGTISSSSVSLTTPIAPLDSSGYGIHRILRTHQKGGMGRILIAYDQFLKRDVALKELHPEVADDMSIVRRFIGEAEVTAQLEHPGIVPIHTLSLDRNQHPYYTMKLIKGHTLQEAIKAYHRNPSHAELMHLVRRLVSICKTMAFAHKKGVIHRDLKPANIMLGEHGETLVMDWGLAKPLEQLKSEQTTRASVAIDYRSEPPRPELTMVGAIVGTPAFMSPEQASPEESRVGPLSDVFSLGAVLYYLLAGQTAFSGRSTHEVLNKVRAAAPPPPSEIKPNVPPGLEAVCAKAMARNPADRYQSASEMDEDLCRWLDGEPVRAQKETFGQMCRRWIERRRLLAISIPFFLVLVIFLTNIGIYLDRFGRDRYEKDAVLAALHAPVDLTDQDSVFFGGSPGVFVKREPRKTGGTLVACRVEAIPVSEHGVVELVAPAREAWDLTRRSSLQVSIFEPLSENPAPLAEFFIRFGRGSAYVELRPEPDWWSKRRRGNWFTFTVPLKGSAVWTRTQSGEPPIDRIEWIEFHFDASRPSEFQIDNIVLQHGEK